MADLIRVRATKMGYHNLKRRREGTEFNVKPEQFSARWMEKVEDVEPPQASASRSRAKRVEKLVEETPETDLEVI